MLRAPAMPIAVKVTWDTLPGKPASFPPAAHTHAWSEITGKPNLYPPAAHSHLWTDLTDKPATFPPAAHTHPWTDVTGKPATYPPAAHTHLWADITERPAIPAATPLSDANPAALAKVAAPGASASASRGDHVHPLPPGRWELVGTLDAGETSLISLALGMKRKTLALTGVAITDKLLAVPNGTPTAGCEVINAYPGATAGQVSIGYYTPALGIAAAYSIPVAVYRLT